MAYSQLSGHIEIIECSSKEVTLVKAEMDRISYSFRGDIIYNLLEEIETLQNRVRILEQKETGQISCNYRKWLAGV